MRVKSGSLFIAILAAFVVVSAASALAAQAKTLHIFNGSDGANPLAGLVMDAAGNLYGTTALGGPDDAGTVFKLSPQPGGWTQTILFNFNVAYGYIPRASLIFDGEGNLYGTTELGGAYGHGTVFELSPNLGGGWDETVLYSFQDFRDTGDGNNPRANVTLDASGNLYGTTFAGGMDGCMDGCGAIFKLTRHGSSWTESVLYRFNGDDGAGPAGGVVFDSRGNLYGTTAEGGSGSGGTAFELSPNGSGGWTEITLHDFDSHDPAGNIPLAGLILDRAGNLYGTTSNDGSNRGGTAFELSNDGSGGWLERAIHSFGGPGDGSNPDAALAFDRNGNLYGTTVGGSLDYFYGTVFKLSPNGRGGWSATILHSFSRTNGWVPLAPVIIDSTGNVYGTTANGGADNDGVVFEVSP